MATVHSGKLAAGQVGAFVQAGKATVTVVSLKTGVRYTYRVKKADEKPGQKPLWFVSVLTGPENTSNYSYLGVIRADGHFGLTKASKMAADSKPVAAFQWLLKCAAAGLLAGIEVWHEGHCGRCGKALTVPTSIEMGIGPECSKLMLAA